jgi:hypothetical protein
LFFIVDGIWLVLFSLVNIKLYLEKEGVPPIKWDALLVIALGLMVLHLSLINSSIRFGTPISYNELPKSFIHLIYQEDGLLESLTVLALVISGVNLFRSARLAVLDSNDKRNVFLLFFMATFCWLVAMEEISWGQRIFLWDTPFAMQKMNSQNETNLHNLSANCTQLEQIFTVCFSLILLVSVALKNTLVPIGMRKIFPGEKYYFSTIYLVIAINIAPELFEEILSLTFLFYSLEILRDYRKTKPRYG